MGDARAKSVHRSALSVFLGRLKVVRMRSKKSWRLLVIFLSVNLYILAPLQAEYLLTEQTEQTAKIEQIAKIEEIDNPAKASTVVTKNDDKLVTRARQVFLISDIDDTVKMSQINQFWKMVSNYWKGVGAFPHIFDIYRDIIAYHEKRGEKVQVYYLTATLKIFDVEKWLKRENAPVGIVLQKPMRKIFMGLYRYKLSSLEGIFHGNPLSLIVKPKIYFFGDNGQKDPFVYRDFVDSLLKEGEGREQKGQARVKSNYSLTIEDLPIFIRSVIPYPAELAGLNYFLSEWDLANSLLLEVIVSDQTRSAIHQSLLAQALIPDYIRLEFEMLKVDKLPVP
jgi:hypothetical protein